MKVKLSEGVLCWATKLGLTQMTDAHERNLLIKLITLASCIKYSLANEQPQEVISRNWKLTTI